MKPKKRIVKHYQPKTIRDWQIRKYVRVAIICGLSFIGILIYFYIKSKAL